MKTALATRLAIRIANLAADSAQACELCRIAAIEHDLPTARYAQLLLEVARIRSQFDGSAPLRSRTAAYA